MNQALDSVFYSNSPQATVISNLFLIVLIICLIILLVVTFMVVGGIIRFRQKPGNEEDPKPTYGNFKLELVWTIIPSCVVIFLLVLTVRAMNGSMPSSSSSQPDLVITGHQWWWEGQYVNSGVVVANEIHIPVGTKWLVEVKSADVIHSFWVPCLGPKIDAVPGHPNWAWLQADEPGTYLGTCSEFCGAGHAYMHFLVIAQPVTEFNDWLQQEEKPAHPVLDATAKKGYELFQTMTCVNCHSINGSPATGQAAPDLTHFASRETLGAVTLPNTPENLSLWLKNPQAIKPEVLMPNFKLTDDQVADLTAYLEALK